MRFRIGLGGQMAALRSARLGVRFQGDFVQKWGEVEGKLIGRQRVPGYGRPRERGRTVRDLTGKSGDSSKLAKLFFGFPSGEGGLRRPRLGGDRNAQKRNVHLTLTPKSRCLEWSLWSSWNP